MEIFSKDLIFGNFRASDHGLMLASFSHKGESEDELEIIPSVIEEYIGQNPVPIYLGQKYEDKLHFTFTLIKNPCVYGYDLIFTEKELRAVLRALTGIKGYQWTKLINEEIDEDLWYNSKISNVSYKRVGGQIVGMIFEAECDSAFAWSAENEITINAITNTPFHIFNNTDDLHNYVLPTVEIQIKEGSTFSIKNVTDNEWKTAILYLQPSETITMDSRREIITSSDTTRTSILNSFNLHFIRLVPDKNTFISSVDAIIKFKFRVPRKVGFVE